MRIIAIYDNGGKTLDRYTVVTDQRSGKWYEMLGLSSNPTDYNGFSQWGNGQYDRTTSNTHLGRKISFEILDERIQQHIATRVFGEDK